MIKHPRPQFVNDLLTYHCLSYFYARKISQQHSLCLHIHSFIHSYIPLSLNISCSIYVTSEPSGVSNVIHSPHSISAGRMAVKTMHEMNGVTNGVTNGHTPVELWRHPDPRSSRMWGFKDTLNSKYGLNLQTYDELYRWSIENIPQFWAETWSFCGVEASQPFKKVGNIFAFSHVIRNLPKLSLTMMSVMAQQVASELQWNNQVV